MVFTRGPTFATIGGILALISGFIGFVAFPRIVKNEVQKSVKVMEGSDAYKIWETAPIPVVYKMYFFNVTNAREVQNGAKPIVKEMGPYIYNQYRRKINISRKDDILSYWQYQRYEFDQKASAPLKDTDDITIVNLPLMSIATVAEYSAGTAYYQLELLNASIPTLFDNPSSMFLKTTPKDFLFDGVYIMCNASGFMNAIICSMINSYAPAMMPRLEDGRFRFSLYGHKNDTQIDYYSINSGMTDINQLGEIVAWDNSSTVNSWPKDSTCEKIIGSDAAIFPPFRTTRSVLNHFNTDICRTVSVNYSENVTYSGLHGYRYVIDKNTFNSPSNYSANECFCLHRTEGIKANDGCLLDGVIELWECQGAPALISLPHFYLANEVYQNGVDGLKPDASRHTMFLDLEPITGTLLRGSKRAQVNVFIRPIARIGITTNLPITLMPVLWIDESIELTDEYIDLLNRKLFNVLDVLAGVKWTTTICGAILFTWGLIWMLRSRWYRREVTKLV